MKRYWVVSSIALALGLALTACGGGEDTATQPPPTSTLAPSPTRPPTAAPTAAPSPTPPPAVAPTLAPSPTPTPRTAVATPITLPGKRGGTLNLRAIFSPVTWDTFTARGTSDFHAMGSLMNNLIWPDPYGDGNTLVGDTAEGWVVGSGGKALTFRLRKDVKFQDGKPFTARDVVYNFERARKPRDAQTTFFVSAFKPIEKVEALDDFTVGLTLAAPSNAMLRVISLNQFLMYPSHVPLPEQLEQWQKAPLGTGPFKLQRIEPAIKMEVVRNDAYWKPGLPYLDGIVYTVIASGDTAISALRAGRLDASNLDAVVVDGLSEQVRREIGFSAYPMVNSMQVVHFRQVEPFTNKLVRQAIHRAVDRETIVRVWLQGRGTQFASPLIPPELGGQWGIPASELKTRPGYRADRTADMAEAKKMLADAGVDPKKVSFTIMNRTSSPQFAEVFEQNMRDLGFQTKIELLEPPQMSERTRGGTFEVAGDTASTVFDDPADILRNIAGTGGVLNHGKWSNAKLDAMLADQDSILDVAQRKKVLRDLQEMVLDDLVFIPVVYRLSASGALPWVKNYPQKLPFLFSSRFRWEQVWLER